LQPAAGMILAFFHGLSRSSKPWLRSFFAIMRCGNGQFQLPID
jgi:hypothetical protein